MATSVASGADAFFLRHGLDVLKASADGRNDGRYHEGVVWRHLEAAKAAAKPGAKAAGPRSGRVHPQGALDKVNWIAYSRAVLANLRGALLDDIKGLKEVWRKESESLGRDAAERVMWDECKRAAEKEEALDAEREASRGASVSPFSAVESRAPSERVRAIACGDWALAESLERRPEIFLFVSSTFLDTVAERDYLQRWVFRDLFDLAKGLGIEFNTVDLRWGVSDDKNDDHSTVELCLAEIDRCLKRSAGVAFLLLSGDRYGWRALPRVVAADEFDTLLTGVAPGVEADTCRFWYRRDDNAIPAVYALRRVSAGEASGAAPAPPELPHAVRRFFPARGADASSSAQGVMWKCLRAAARGARLSGPALDKWVVSATHREVLRATDAGVNAAVTDNSLCVVRDLLGLRAAAGGHAVDKAVGDYLETDAEAASLLLDMRSAALTAVRPRNIIHVSAEWGVGGVTLASHATYIRGLASTMYAKLAASARRVADAWSHARLSACDADIVAHAAAVARRAAAFRGRESLVVDATALAKPVGSPSSVRMMRGASGTGKTSLMCSAASCLAAELPPGSVCVRLCGTSALSATAVHLLASICHQLEMCLGREVRPPDGDLKSAARRLRDLLAGATEARPIVILIDSLDQLGDDDGATSEPWRWLPTVVPPWATVVVSTLPDDGGMAIAGTLLLGGASPVLEVPAVPAAQALPDLDNWLAASGRRITISQRAALAPVVAGPAGCTMLHLKLLVDRAAKWTSESAAVGAAGGPLPATPAGLIDLLFAELEAEHGAPLVRRLLGLLCCTRARALSETNLIDVASACDDVLSWPGQQGTRGGVLQRNEPPQRRVPPLVIKRLLDSMRDFIVERAGCLTFYHRQFWEAAERRYVTPAMRPYLHGVLADYFSGASAARHPTRGLLPHAVCDPSRGGRVTRSAQALSELAPALTGGGPGCLRRLVDVITDLIYVQQKAEAGALDDLGREYGEAASALDAAKVITGGSGRAEAARFALIARVSAFAAWLRVHGHLICVNPKLTLPLAYSSAAEDGPVGRDAAELLAAGAFTAAEPWVDNPVGRSAAGAAAAMGDGSAALLVIAGYSGAAVRCCALGASSGETTPAMLFSGGDDRCLRCYSRVTGVALQSLPSAGGAILALSLSADGTRVCTASSDGTTRVVRLSDGATVMLKPPPPAVSGACRACDMMEDTGLDWVATGHVDAAIRLWCIDKATWGQVQSAAAGGPPATTLLPVTLLPCTRGAVVALRFCPHAMHLAAACDDGVAYLWRRTAGNASAPFAGGPSHVLSGGHDPGASVTTLAFGPGGKRLLTAGNDHRVVMWVTATGAPAGCLWGHPDAVLSVTWAGDVIATGGADGVARLWAAGGTNAQLASFPGATGPITCVALRGTTLLTSSADGKLRVHDASHRVRVTLFDHFFGWALIRIEDPRVHNAVILAIMAAAILAAPISGVLLAANFMIPFLRSGFLTRLSYMVPGYRLLDPDDFKQSGVFFDDPQNFRGLRRYLFVRTPAEMERWNHGCAVAASDAGTAVPPSPSAASAPIEFTPPPPNFWQRYYHRLEGSKGLEYALVLFVVVTIRVVLTLAIFACPLAICLGGVPAVFVVAPFVSYWGINFTSYRAEIERARATFGLPKLEDMRPRDDRARTYPGTGTRITLVPPTRPRSLVFSACGHTYTVITHGDRLRTVDAVSNVVVTEGDPICQLLVSNGHRSLQLCWDDADIDADEAGGGARVRPGFEKYLFEGLGLIPFRRLTGRFDGSLRVKTINPCTQAPSTALPHYYLGDASHRIVPRCGLTHAFHAVRRAALSRDGNTLVLLMGRDTDMVRAAMLCDVEPTSTAWVFDLTPAERRARSTIDNRTGLNTGWLYAWALPWVPLPRPSPACELHGGGDGVMLSVALDGFTNRHALIGFDTGAARLFDLKTGASGVRLVGHRGPVVCCAYSPPGDSPTLSLPLTAGADGTARLWSLAGACLAIMTPSTVPGATPVMAMSASFSPDGTRVLVAGGGIAGLFSLAGEASNLRTEPLWAGPHTAGVAVTDAWAPDGRHVALADDDAIRIVRARVPMHPNAVPGSGVPLPELAVICPLPASDVPCLVTWGPAAAPDRIVVGLTRGGVRACLNLKIHGRLE